MNLLEEVRTYLLTQAKNHTAIADAIGARIYPDKEPQKAIAPYVVLLEVDDVPYEHLGGASGVSDARVQVDCKADTSPAAAAAVRALMIDALQGYRGPLGAIFANGVSLAGRSGGQSSPVDGSDASRYVRSADFILSHTEPIPQP